MTRAPEMRIAGIRTIKIDTFESGSYCQTSIWGPQQDALAVQASSLAFAPNLRDYPKFIRAALRDGRYKISESDDFDARISGLVTCDMELESRLFEPKNRDGKLEQRYEVERRTTITVKFSVVSKSGESFAASISAAKGETQFGDSVKTAASRLQGLPLFVIDSPMEETADKLLQKISPHVVREYRNLASGHAAMIKNGNAAAEKGNWQEAVSLWTQASQSADHTDQIASLYNLAIYDERQGKLDDARKKYEKIYASTHEPKYMRAAASVKTRMEEEGWLRNQSGKKEMTPVKGL